MKPTTPAKTAIAAAMLAAPMLLGMAHTANATAGAGQIVHINGEGRHICRSLAAQGPYWDAKVRGRLLDSYAGNSRFVLRTCFKTQSQCYNYVGNIKHYVQGIEVISYAGCAPR